MYALTKLQPHMPMTLGVMALQGSNSKKSRFLLGK